MSWSIRPLMKTLVLMTALLLAAGSVAGGSSSTSGLASWYGEAHRGKAMANRQKFDPDKLTAASWFYPLGTRVRVTNEDGQSVIVTITDRGPAKRLVRDGRIIDLSHAAFAKLASPDLGLIAVSVAVVKPDLTVTVASR